MLSVGWTRSRAIWNTSIVAEPCVWHKWRIKLLLDLNWLHDLYGMKEFDSQHATMPALRPWAMTTRSFLKCKCGLFRPTILHWDCCVFVCRKLRFILSFLNFIIILEWLTHTPPHTKAWLNNRWFKEKKKKPHHPPEDLWLCYFLIKKPLILLYTNVFYGMLL